MKKYSKPNVELVFFTVEPILIISGPNNGAVSPADPFNPSQEEYDMFQEYYDKGGQMTQGFVFTW